MALMGGLLWLASQGHVWARDLVVTAGPLFILAAGILAVIIVTDHDDLVGKSGIVAGVAFLFMARFGIVPEATILTLGPWPLIVMGTVIALSGVCPSSARRQMTADAVRWAVVGTRKER
jgi:hypothetical protein